MSAHGLQEYQMLDWDDIRFFLAIQRHGSLSSAARELGVAQSTAGRRLAALEKNLGVRLLDRTPEGYILTLAGRDVRERAERLEEEAIALERTVSGRDSHLSGLVRITCAEAMAAHILAPCFEALHSEHTDILIELIPDPRELSLSMREAEISVRLTQPNQHDLIIRRLGSLSYGLYASRDYIARLGVPRFTDGCSQHRVVRQYNDVETAPQFGWLSEVTSRAKVVFQTSSHEAAVAAAVNGAGLACLARFRADRENELVLLDPPASPPTTGIWLVMHKDNQSNKRIRAVTTHIVAAIRAMTETLMPVGSSRADPALDGSA